MENTTQVLDLSTYTFPTGRGSYYIPKELIDEANRREHLKEYNYLKDGKKIFTTAFFDGLEVKLKKETTEVGTWQNSAWKYMGVMMGSFAPKHEHKEIVCAMILQECVDFPTN